MSSRHSIVFIGGAFALIGAAVALDASPVRQASPLSGTWAEESVLGPGRPPWGSRFTTAHDGARFAVVGAETVSSYLLDGRPRDRYVDLSACSSTVRRTVADERRGQIVITESIVASHRNAPRAHASCLFDDSDEPDLADAGPPRRGAALDTVIVVSREGDRLIVEMTTAGAQGPVTTRAVHRPVQ